MSSSGGEFNQISLMQVYELTTDNMISGHHSDKDSAKLLLIHGAAIDKVWWTKA